MRGVGEREENGCMANKISPSCVKPFFVSPKPWSRIRILVFFPSLDGKISHNRFFGRSSTVGRRGVVIFTLIFIELEFPQPCLLFQRGWFSLHHLRRRAPWIFINIHETTSNYANDETANLESLTRLSSLDKTSILPSDIYGEANEACSAEPLTNRQCLPSPPRKVSIIYLLVAKWELPRERKGQSGSLLKLRCRSFALC